MKNIPRNLVFLGFLFNRELRAEPRAAIFVLVKSNLERIRIYSNEHFKLKMKFPFNEKDNMVEK